MPTRNLGLDLMRATEAAALAAARFVGRGDKEGGDRAAVEAMRLLLNSLDSVSHTHTTLPTNNTA
ncbi:fructose-bisphosphatase class II [Thermus scotoductus]|uniref:fructose-bisphosphatase class II n=1 Tax=Thermus scotoductus TaxID=37636 RepID=UPI0020A36CAB|nr:fructose-bisphosphatase class II [Thermus scotoductus]